MQSVNIRRKRRRRPTITPRFGAGSIALELGLLRLTLESQRELEKREDKEKDK